MMKIFITKRFSGVIFFFEHYKKMLKFLWNANKSEPQREAGSGPFLVLAALPLDVQNAPLVVDLWKLMERAHGPDPPVA